MKLKLISSDHYIKSVRFYHCNRQNRLHAEVEVTKNENEACIFDSGYQAESIWTLLVDCGVSTRVEH